MSNTTDCHFNCRDVFYDGGRRRVREVLIRGGNQILMPFFRSAAAEGYGQQTLECIDKGIIITIITVNVSYRVRLFRLLAEFRLFMSAW